MNIIVSYRGIPHARGRETGAILARAFRRLGHNVSEYGNYYHSQEPLSDIKLSGSWDLLVYCECNDEEPQYYELAKLQVRYKVYWDFDIHTHPTKSLLFIRRMDFNIIFYANKLYQSSFERLCPQSYFLPYAIDDEFHRKIPTIEKSVDIGICGSPYPSRLDLIQRLNEAGLEARLFNGVFGEDMVRLINCFRIHLNYNPSWGRGILNGRVWETTGCGTLLLTQDQDFIDLFFQNGKHLVLYHDTQECIEKARGLLQNNEAREEIALEGYRLVHQTHTYIARATTMLNTLSTLNETGLKKPNLSAALLEIVRSKFRGGIKN